MARRRANQNTAPALVDHICTVWEIRKNLFRVYVLKASGMDDELVVEMNASVFPFSYHMPTRFRGLAVQYRTWTATSAFSQY